jgi:NADH-quinone oxidoreductase subunit I
MTHLFEMSTTTRDDAIYTRDELLVAPDGTPNHPDPPNRLIDLEELRLGSGWMRATSPSGRADFEGVVAWTPSATQGELPPEVGQSSGPLGRVSSSAGDKTLSDPSGSLDTTSRSSDSHSEEELPTDPLGSPDRGGSA